MRQKEMNKYKACTLPPTKGAMHRLPDSMKAEEIRIAALGDEHISMLSELTLHGCPLTKAEVQKGLQLYWSFRDEIAIIDGIAM